MRGDYDDDEPRTFHGPSMEGPTSRPSTAGSAAPLREPLTSEAAEQLMAIIGATELPAAWAQGFFFAGYQPYGLQQVEGGPCGVIAVVQAFMLQCLQRSAARPEEILQVSESARQDALCDAICEILWVNVGDNKKATLMIPSSAAVVPLTASQCRCLQPAEFTSYEQLRLSLNMRPFRDLLFRPSGCGVLLFLYSLVWTRGIAGIRDRDVDDPSTGVMIGAHGYCTQELVNLMVFGRAYSNVFDGSKRLGSKQDGWCVLQGAPRRAKVGFLSLFEAFQCIEVGSRYKGPSSPVWIVCAESHYTVLFATEPSVDPRDTEMPVELYYFDQMARQGEPIRLTVEPNSLPAHLETGFEESESMIDRCIRTKWAQASVDWNGSEPIL